MTDEISVCAQHGPLERKIDAGFSAQERVLERIENQLKEFLVEMTRREEREKTTTQEMDRLRQHVEEVPYQIAGSLRQHVSECAIGDITKTEIRLPSSRTRSTDRDGGYDTPSGGTRRGSLNPRGTIRIPVPSWVLWVAVAVGVILSVGVMLWRACSDEPIINLLSHTTSAATSAQR